MIQALPTNYNGITFRSRTEARWAVFFEALGIVWEHEREGFDVSGRWYLPDFHLPQFPLWFEVKPDETDGSERGHFGELCRLSGKAGIIAYGPPNIGASNLAYYSARDSGWWPDEAQHSRWLADRRDDGVYWIGDGESYGLEIGGPGQSTSHTKDPIVSPALRRAFEAAAAERFGT